MVLEEGTNLSFNVNLSFHCLQVGTSVLTEGADFALESIHNIREALPEIWEEGDAESSKNVQDSGEGVATIEPAVST